MMARARYIVRWSSLPGGFHDRDDRAAAIAFARSQARYLSPQSRWAVTDRNQGNAVVARSEDGMAFFAAKAE